MNLEELVSLIAEGEESIEKCIANVQEAKRRYLLANGWKDFGGGWFGCDKYDADDLFQVDDAYRITRPDYRVEQLLGPDAQRCNLRIENKSQFHVRILFSESEPKTETWDAGTILLSGEFREWLPAPKGSAWMQKSVWMRIDARNPSGFGRSSGPGNNVAVAIY